MPTFGTRVNSEILFRPNRNRRRNGSCDFLNRPFVIAAGNNRKAVRCRAVPSSAKTFGVDLPGAKALAAGLLERFTAHLAVRRKGHLKFSSGKTYGGERLSVKEGRLDVCRRYRLGSYCRGTHEHYSCKDQHRKLGQANSPIRALQCAKERIKLCARPSHF